MKVSWIEFKLHCTWPIFNIFVMDGCIVMSPPLVGGGIKRWCASDVCVSVWRSSVWRLSVAYIGPKSTTVIKAQEDQNWHRGSPRLTWLGHHFQGQRSKVIRPLYSPPCWRVRQLQRWAWERVGREKLPLCCRLLGRARSFGAHEGGDVRVYIVAAARLQLVHVMPASQTQTTC